MDAASVDLLYRRCRPNVAGRERPLTGGSIVFCRARGNNSMRRSVRQRTDYIQNCAHHRACVASLKNGADEFAYIRPVAAPKFTAGTLCKPND